MSMNPITMPYQQQLYVPTTSTMAATSTQDQNGSVYTTSVPDSQKVDLSAKDGKNDGKIGFFDKVGNFFKGAVKTVANAVTGVLTDPKKLLATAAIVGACFIPGIGPIVAAGLSGVGLIQGGKTILDSATKASNATTDAEAEAAWENMGGGALEVGASALGLKATFGAAKAALGSGVQGFKAGTTVGGKLGGFAKGATGIDDAAIAANGGGFVGGLKATGQATASNLKAAGHAVKNKFGGKQTTAQQANGMKNDGTLYEDYHVKVDKNGTMINKNIDLDGSFEINHYGTRKMYTAANTTQAQGLSVIDDAAKNQGLMTVEAKTKTLSTVNDAAQTQTLGVVDNAAQSTGNSRIDKFNARVSKADPNLNRASTTKAGQKALDAHQEIIRKAQGQQTPQTKTLSTVDDAAQTQTLGVVDDAAGQAKALGTADDAAQGTTAQAKGIDIQKINNMTDAQRTYFMETQIQELAKKLGSLDKAYKQLAKQYHPNAYPASQADLYHNSGISLSQAYKNLQKGIAAPNPTTVSAGTNTNTAGSTYRHTYNNANTGTNTNTTGSTTGNTGANTSTNTTTAGTTSPLPKGFGRNVTAGVTPVIIDELYPNNTFENAA